MVRVEKLGCFFTISCDFYLSKEPEFLQVFSLSLCYKATYAFLFYFRMTLKLKFASKPCLQLTLKTRPFLEVIYKY